MEQNKKIKILYISTNSDLGGISKYLLEITAKLPENVEPYFLMATSGYFSEELEKLGISKDNIFFIEMTNDIFNIPLHIKSNLKALKLIKKIKPDIIHCNATTGAIVGAVCGFLTGTKTIYTVHGWPFTDGISKAKQLFYKFLEALICLVFKKIICVSKYDREIGIKVLPFYKHKMKTIHNGIADIEDGYKKKAFSDDCIKIIMVSRFCPQKDPYTLIKAVHECNKEGMNIKLDLFGYGKELQQVKDLITECDSENIQYKGEISDVTPILKDYDVYSLISNWEGLPIGIIEGMRAGLPVLVSNVGGNSECVKGNGYLVKRQDVLDCKQRIKALWDNRQNLSKFGQNSRNLYCEEFSSNKMIEETISSCFDIV